MYFDRMRNMQTCEELYTVKAAPASPRAAPVASQISVRRVTKVAWVKLAIAADKWGETSGLRLAINK